MNNLFDIIKNRLEKIGITYPLEKEEYSLTYGKIFFDTDIIWNERIDNVIIEFGIDSEGDVLYCIDDEKSSSCRYRLDSENRLTTRDILKHRYSSKRGIKFLCDICGYIPKNSFQILVPKPL